MKLKVDVTACDIDKRWPAKTYTITADDGRSISKDLCEEHAEPIEEWLEEAELMEESEPEPEPDPKPEPEPDPKPAARPAAKKAPAKAPAKRAAKKATPARRGPRIMSLEQIEAEKKK
ncbi:hypothetical protein ACFYQA_22530 [Streptomyces sp. NPDC005774]|uniref:hypothetical protein n=1 Tax=Streptomyces sp. NPDC005774 TaxID=3364728 RepID=UPI0036BB8EE5